MKRELRLANTQEAVPFLVEVQAFEGVKRIAGKVAADVEKVCGARPEVKELEYVQEEWRIRPMECTDKGDSVPAGKCIGRAGADSIPAGKCTGRAGADSVPIGECMDGNTPGIQCVAAATLGKSTLAARLAKQGLLTAQMLEQVEGKREVYALQLIEKPFPGVERMLLILGSDKRGTIYGMFRLSEYLGVSPLCFWGDAEPAHRDSFMFSQEMEMVSKEPSVRYRGFFINDEWPCFGNWTFSHFGGFTAKMYDHVFELLLRLKGNYLWPAMWSSSFPLDGPGGMNEELADIYGVVIGFSHHEPCLRASEEWDLVRGQDSPYGNEWNYYTNGEGLSRYWADGLKRSGKYEHLITIGMRGERDSSMLGENASLQENIELLKKIILRQRELIREHVNEELDQVPQLLALYKEVEDYFYGDEQTEGLKDWKELEHVAFMLCEDNFGHMRTLPTEELRSHKGGFGMYYHLDYHGNPVSYEWMPSTPLPRIWEQMTQAYDYGVRDVWMVNVGDLKGNEIALSYFLTLAYDFEAWGSSRLGSDREYLKKWVKDTFPCISESLKEAMAQVYERYVAVNARRRPEALHAGIYHPCHYQETDRQLAEADGIEALNERIYEALEGRERMAYYSMLYHPAKASINHLRMYLYAGKNAHYAFQGRKAANRYGVLVKECIEEDRRLNAAFGSFRDGKWKGMELEQHIGFTKWNDDGWRYPVRMEVEPVTSPRMSVSRADGEQLAVKNYGAPSCIVLDDFQWMGCDEVTLEISNDGVGSLEYEITPQQGIQGEAPWLHWSCMKGTVEELERVSVRCDRARCPAQSWSVRFHISDADTTVAVEVKGCAADAWTAESLGLTEPVENLFLPARAGIVMEAEHYHAAKEISGTGFRRLSGFRSGSGMKMLPSTVCYTEADEKPSLTFAFYLEEEGSYRVELWTAPCNSLRMHTPVRLAVEAPVHETVTLLSGDYRGGDWNDALWSRGVLDQVHKNTWRLPFHKGVNYLTLAAMDAGVVLERIWIHPLDREIRDSYLGPAESSRL